MIKTKSLVKDPQGVNFKASPKHPQSLTHWIWIPDADNPPPHVAVWRVKIRKNNSIDISKNTVSLIFEPTIKQKPNTTSRTHINIAKYKEYSISHSNENDDHPNKSWTLYARAPSWK